MLRLWTDACSGGGVFLEIEGQFREHPEAVVSHLDGVERSTGFAVAPGALGSALGNGQIGVDVEDIIDPCDEGGLPAQLVREVEIGGQLGIEHEIFGNGGFPVIRSDIGVPAIAAVRYARSAELARRRIGKAVVAEALSGQL